VVLAVRSEGPIPVVGDALRLSQVVVNLVSNALKFTKQGSVTVEVVRADGRAVVRVSDTGEGFAPEDLPRLFRPFAQLHRGRGGSGLGLYISRAIVEQHGGTIEAASRGPGTGATFAFTLPCAPAPPKGLPGDDPALLSAP
jgi:signal transduction histidine kinase